MNKLQQSKISFFITISIIFVLLICLVVFGCKKAEKPISQLIMTSYEKALTKADIKLNTQQEILKQLKGKNPIAFVSGFWVFTLDYGRVYNNAAIYNALASNLSSDFGVKSTENLISAQNFKHTQGLIFVPNNLNILEQIGRGDLGGFYPGFRVDIGDIFGMWGWRDDTEDDPWPDDPDPWPPDDPEPDPDPDPWPDDPQPWPPDDKVRPVHIFNKGIMLDSMIQELPGLYKIMSKTAKSDKAIRLSSTEKGVSVKLILPVK